MKELVKELVANLLNPSKKETRNFDPKTELRIKFDRSLHLKEYLKSWAWLEFNRPLVYNSLEDGITTLLRGGLTMDETGIKAVISSMRANLNQIQEMRQRIEEGERAAEKLERMK